MVREADAGEGVYSLPSLQFGIGFEGLASFCNFHDGDEFGERILVALDGAAEEPVVLHGA